MPAAARRFFDAAPAEVKEVLEAQGGHAVVNGFTGSSIWHVLYGFPPFLPGQIDAGFEVAPGALTFGVEHGALPPAAEFKVGAERDRNTTHDGTVQSTPQLLTPTNLNATDP